MQPVLCSRVKNSVPLMQALGEGKSHEHSGEGSTVHIGYEAVRVAGPVYTPCRSENFPTKNRTRISPCHAGHGVVALPPPTLTKRAGLLDCGKEQFIVGAAGGGDKWP